MKHDKKNEYRNWVKAVQKLAELGWECEHKWIFRSPRGTLHDLSAAMLAEKALLHIMVNGLYYVEIRHPIVFEGVP